MVFNASMAPFLYVDRKYGNAPVRKHLRNKTADAVMSHGVQLPDLFEALPTAEAQREFQRELATMRSLCLKLLEQKQLVA